MIFDTFTPQELAGNAAAVTTLGGMALWFVRKLRSIHRQLSSIWLFLVGDEMTESLIDRLLKEEFRSRFMMMHANEGVFECSADGMCTFANPQLAHMFGLETAQMLGKGWLQALQPTDRIRVWQNWEEAIKIQTPYEATYVLKDGKRVRVITYTCYGAEHKKPLYFIGVVRDVTLGTSNLIRGGTHDSP